MDDDAGGLRLDMPDGAAQRAADYLTGYRDGVDDGHSVGTRELANARREAAENAWSRARQAAAEFAPAETDRKVNRAMLWGILIGAASVWVILRGNDADDADVRRVIPGRPVEPPRDFTITEDEDGATS